MKLICDNCGATVDVRSVACGECGADPSAEHLRLRAALPPYKSGTNGIAIASLVSSLVGLFFLPFVGTVVGVVLGHVARRRIANEPQDGDGFAIAGLIIGYLGIALWMGFAFLFFWLSRVVPSAF
jgi:Domain of unknown function (DUF4190)